MAAPQPRAQGEAGPNGREERAGDLTYDPAALCGIAACALREVRGVARTTDDVDLGFLGRLLGGRPSFPGITVESGGDGLVIRVEVVARHGVNLYDLGLEVQRHLAERVRHMTGSECAVDVRIHDVSR